MLLLGNKTSTEKYYITKKLAPKKNIGVNYREMCVARIYYFLNIKKNVIIFKDKKKLYMRYDINVTKDEKDKRD